MYKRLRDPIRIKTLLFQFYLWKLKNFYRKFRPKKDNSISNTLHNLFQCNHLWHNRCKEIISEVTNLTNRTCLTSESNKGSEKTQIPDDVEMDLNNLQMNQSHTSQKRINRTIINTRKSINLHSRNNQKCILSQWKKCIRLITHIKISSINNKSFKIH